MTPHDEAADTRNEARSARFGDIDVTCRVVSINAAMGYSMQVQAIERIVKAEPDAEKGARLEYRLFGELVESMMSDIIINPEDMIRIGQELSGGRCDTEGMLRALLGRPNEPENREQRRAARKRGRGRRR